MEEWALLCRCAPVVCVASRYLLSASAHRFSDSAIPLQSRELGLSFLHSHSNLNYWQHKNGDSQVRDVQLHSMFDAMRQHSSARYPPTRHRPTSPFPTGFSERIAVHSISISRIWSDNHNAVVALGICFVSWQSKRRSETALRTKVGNTTQSGKW